MVAFLWELDMNFRVAKPFAIFVLFSACGKLAPEEKKTISPEIVFQALSSYVSHDEESGAWSTSFYFWKRLVSESGEGVALASGESILVNGNAFQETKGDTYVSYWYQGESEPTAPLQFVWTAKGGKTYSNTCGGKRFEVETLPATISISAGLELSATAETTSGFFSGGLNQAVDNAASRSASASVTQTEGAPTGIIEFKSSALASLVPGEASLSVSWSETPALTETTPKGGSCTATFTRRRTVTIVE